MVGRSRRRRAPRGGSGTALQPPGADALRRLVQVSAFAIIQTGSDPSQGGSQHGDDRHPYRGQLCREIDDHLRVLRSAFSRPCRAMEQRPCQVAAPNGGWRPRAVPSKSLTRVGIQGPPCQLAIAGSGPGAPACQGPAAVHTSYRLGREQSFTVRRARRAEPAQQAQSHAQAHALLYYRLKRSRGDTK